MFSDTTDGEGRLALPIQHSAFRLVFFSCNSTPCWWRRDRFPLIAGKGGHGVCLIKSPQAKRFSLSLARLLRIAHRLFNLFQKEKQNKKQTPKPNNQQHTGKSRCASSSWENKGQRLRQELTLGWEVSFPAQEDTFGKDSGTTSTCCPTGMDDVCDV